jgi:hypothetical protein
MIVYVYNTYDSIGIRKGKKKFSKEMAGALEFIKLIFLELK